MADQNYHVAQANYAVMLAPLDDPMMKEFVAQLDAINRLADDARDFVWRLKSDSGNATDVRVFERDDMIFNMSVWKSIDALFEYTYYSGHVEIFKQRKDWFEKLDKPILALWYVPAGHNPTVAEAEARFLHMEQHGSTPYAFSFKERFTVEEFLNSEYAEV